MPFRVISCSLVAEFKSINSADLAGAAGFAGSAFAAGAFWAGFAAAPCADPVDDASVNTNNSERQETRTRDRRFMTAPGKGGRVKEYDARMSPWRAITLEIRSAIN